MYMEMYGPLGTSERRCRAWEASTASAGGNSVELSVAIPAHQGGPLGISGDSMEGASPCPTFRPSLFLLLTSYKHYKGKITKTIAVQRMAGSRVSPSSALSLTGPMNKQTCWWWALGLSWGDAGTFREQHILLRILCE